jgi:hypothetical protein
MLFLELLASAATSAFSKPSHPTGSETRTGTLGTTADNLQGCRPFRVVSAQQGSALLDLLSTVGLAEHCWT